MVAVEHNILSFQIALWIVEDTALIGRSFAQPLLACRHVNAGDNVFSVLWRIREPVYCSCITSCHFGRSVNYFTIPETYLISLIIKLTSGKINGPVSVFARLPYFEKTIPHANPLPPTYELSHLILVFCLKPRVPLRVFFSWISLLAQSSYFPIFRY